MPRVAPLRDELLRDLVQSVVNGLSELWGEILTGGKACGELGAQRRGDVIHTARLPGLANGRPDAAEKELLGGRIGDRSPGLGSAGRLAGGDRAGVVAAPVGAEAGTREAELLWVHRPLQVCEPQLECLENGREIIELRPIGLKL